jgi:hypothetical protein
LERDSAIDNNISFVSYIHKTFNGNRLPGRLMQIRAARAIFRAFSARVLLVSNTWALQPRAELRRAFGAQVDAHRQAAWQLPGRRTPRRIMPPPSADRVNLLAFRVGRILPLLQSYATFFTSTQGSAALYPGLMSSKISYAFGVQPLFGMPPVQRALNSSSTLGSAVPQALGGCQAGATRRKSLWDELHEKSLQPWWFCV